MTARFCLIVKTVIMTMCLTEVCLGIWTGAVRTANSWQLLASGLLYGGAVEGLWVAIRLPVRLANGPHE